MNRALLRFLGVAVAVAVASCSRGEEPGAGAETTAEGSAETATSTAPGESGGTENGGTENDSAGGEQGAGEGNAAAVAAENPGVGSPGEDGTGAGDAAANDAPPAALEPPPSLPSVMRRAGFVEASPADLADFVHVPPGAEGQAGVFGEGERSVRVALIAYPNPRYVAPHLSDVQERARVLPDAREAAVASGRMIVHVMAVDGATAREVADRIAAVLGW